MSNPATAHGREGIYFGENGEHSFYENAKAIGEALAAIGKLDNPEPTVFTKEELVKYFGVSSFGKSGFDALSDVEIQGSKLVGTNARGRGIRSRSLGWKPVKTTKDFLESIKPEVIEYVRKKSEKA